MTKCKDMAKISIVYNNVNSCSGLCSFCNAASTLDYQQGLNYNDVDKSLVDIDNKTYKECRFDFDALEKALIQYPTAHLPKWHIGVWGADPLGSFQCYQEIADFLDYMAEKYHKVIKHHCSTNGLAFRRPEVVEFLYKNKDKMTGLQMSHDGVGQYFRTRDLDPLDWDSTKQLMKDGIIKTISLVHHQYNARPLDNIEYFEKKIDEQLLRDLMTIRLFSIRDGQYDVPQTNVSGLLNGKNYEVLKSLPFGDMTIHNDWEMAKKTGVWQFAHQSDDYFDQMSMIYRTINKERWDPYRRILIQRLSSNWKKTPPTETSNRPTCANFHHKLLDYSDCIDTLGMYTECHLYDSSHKVPNPEFKKAEWCQECPYKDSYECNMCGTIDYNHNRCDWMYRFHQMVESTKNSPTIKEWVGLYRAGIWPRRKVS